jgi:molecular chaperone GrpE
MVQVAARLDVVRSILPALDGLDEALRAGRPLLAIGQREGNTDTAYHSVAKAREEPARAGWLRRLLGEPSPPTESARDSAALQQVAELRAGIESWLAGLSFVRQRLLDVLAAQDVRPIVAVGQSFDPNYHVAMGVVPATESHPAGIVVEELRRGYLAGERVLRHAEVVVAASEKRRLEAEPEGA